jgi:DNA-binding transcriptional regulator YiaG
MAWTFETLNSTVDAELAALPKASPRRSARLRELDGADSDSGDCRCAAACQGVVAMTRVKALQRAWSKDRNYRAAYRALEDEFDLARVLIAARARAGLSQAQLARRMKTSQSYVARIEGGQVRPSTRALERIASATGTRLRIDFEPFAQI